MLLKYDRGLATIIGGWSLPLAQPLACEFLLGTSLPSQLSPCTGPQKDAPSTRFVSPCGLQRASPKVPDGKRGSWSVGGSAEGISQPREALQHVRVCLHSLRASFFSPQHAGNHQRHGEALRSGRGGFLRRASADRLLCVPAPRRRCPQWGK